MIVLGAKVNGMSPSLSLQSRINTAARYLKENEKTIVAIVSGGQGPDEDISEAEAMRQGLVAQGIGAERIIIEDKSTSTYENMRFSKKLIPSGLDRGLLVTNDYHLYRAHLLAKQEGLDVTGLPAKTPRVTLVKSYVREYLAILKWYVESLIRGKLMFLKRITVLKRKNRFLSSISFFDSYSYVNRSRH